MGNLLEFFEKNSARFGDSEMALSMQMSKRQDMSDLISNGMLKKTPTKDFNYSEKSPYYFNQNQSPMMEENMESHKRMYAEHKHQMEEAKMLMRTPREDEMTSILKQRSQGKLELTKLEGKAEMANFQNYLLRRKCLPLTTLPMSRRAR